MESQTSTCRTCEGPISLVASENGSEPEWRHANDSVRCSPSPRYVDGYWPKAEPIEEAQK